MTNTKFRKRALLSSVAMLLVALVALGSATFAWFTSTTSASANNLAISTSKSSELKVSKADLVWADSVSYDDEATTYVPTSSADGSNWFTNTAAAKTAFTAGGNYAKPENLSGVVYKEMLNIKNNAPADGGKDAEGVTITVNGSFASSFGRIAIVPVTAQTTAGIANVTGLTAANFKANIYGSGSSDAWKPYNGEAVEAENWSLKGAASGAQITVGKIEPQEVKSYMILVWFEGEDPDCYDLTTSALTIGSTTNLSFAVATS